jgi:hypothetical protein
MTWFNAIMCGWPPVCKDFGSDEQEQSLAVMCPACWRGVMAAGLDGIRGPRPEMTVLTVGPFAATALAATVASSLFRLRSPLCRPDRFGPQRVFDSKKRLGGISKRGDAHLRKLLILGARGSCIGFAAIRWRVRGSPAAGPPPLQHRQRALADIALSLIERQSVPRADLTVNEGAIWELYPLGW